MYASQDTPSTSKIMALVLRSVRVLRANDISPAKKAPGKMTPGIMTPAKITPTKMLPPGVIMTPQGLVIAPKAVAKIMAQSDMQKRTVVRKPGPSTKTVPKKIGNPLAVYSIP